MAEFCAILCNFVFYKMFHSQVLCGHIIVGKITMKRNYYGLYSVEIKFRFLKLVLIYSTNCMASKHMQYPALKENLRNIFTQLLETRQCLVWLLFYTYDDVLAAKEK